MFERFSKFVLSFSIICLFVLYALQKQAQSLGGTSSEAAMLIPVTPTPISTGSMPSVQATVTIAPSNGKSVGFAPPTEAAPTDSPATANPTTSGAYADGTYLGDVTDAHWGDVQVQVVVQNGEISSVEFLTYPDHRSRSRSINKRAMPVLISEAIESQKAKVDIVSGATDTSRAFIQSLKSALEQAA